MKIGIVAHYGAEIIDPLSQIFGITTEILQQEHEIIYLDPKYFYSSKSRQVEILRDMIISADVLLGLIDDLVLQIRDDINKQVPYICFLLGCMPRGATNMKNYHLFRTTDVLIGNCSGDIAIGNKFFENAKIISIPFAFNESDYYPLEEASKQAIKAKLGFKSKDKILLYSGRLTLEKNIHTILRVFSVIQKLIPNTHLIIVGKEHNIPFLEFGVFALSVTSMLKKMITKLGIDKDNVRFVGHKYKADIRELYNVADVMINMTLHHDENFGLAQVEAMACGTPVIGTNWGGLRDTILDGETGYKISTVVTGSGVKVNWWEAVNKIVLLLSNSSEQARMRKNCQETAYAKYSLSQYRKNLQFILDECRAGMASKGERLKASEFAKQFWDSCAPIGEGAVIYKYGVTPYQMYKELITPYTGISHHNTVNQRLTLDHVLCLASPVTQADENTFEINDPIYPLKLTIPTEYKKAAPAIVNIMTEEPSITVKRLVDNYMADYTAVLEVLEWMIETGLILKNNPGIESIPSTAISNKMGISLFSIQSISYSADIGVLR